MKPTLTSAIILKKRILFASNLFLLVNIKSKWLSIEKEPSIICRCGLV